MRNTSHRCTAGAAGLALVLAACVSFVSAIPIAAQDTPKLVAYWDFNNASNPSRTLDKLFGFQGELEGGAAFTTGRTGTGADNAIDFGFSSNNELVRIGNVSFLNYAATEDKITISFWQSLYNITASSAFWGVSPSSSSGQRGIQAHTPWSDNNIYFDTAGCCGNGTQRINGNVVDFEPNFSFGWHHLAFVKNGSTKQIWVNGRLFLEGINTLPLPVDFNSLILGAEPSGGNSLQGAIDDFAVFAGALSSAQIAQLANGTAPDRLTGVPAIDQPLVSGAIGSPIGFSIQITELPSAQLASDSFKATFDGNPVTINVSKSGQVTTVTYSNPATQLPPGSSHQVVLEFKDTTGKDYSAVRSFSVADYLFVSSEFALPLGSGNASQRGFVWNVHQNEALQENRIQRALNQLGGRMIDSGTGQPYDNLADPGAVGVAIAPSTTPNPAWAPIRFDIATVINLSQSAGENNGNFPNDEQMPGIPGINFSTDGIAAEVLTYIEFTQAGVYTMGVNSDDGFQTTVAPRNPNDATGSVLGQFNDGRGAADTIFRFYIPTPGVYPFKTLWFEGGGGANIEWFTVVDGRNVLLNDTANGGLATFRSASVSGVYVSSVTPGTGLTGVRPDTTIEAQLMDAGGQTINQSSVKLMLDGAALTPTITKSGTVTTVRATIPGVLAAGSTHEASVEFAATGGQTLTGRWSFTVANFPAIPASLGSMPGTGVSNQPGINARIYQVEPPDEFASGRIMDNTIENAEAAFAGAYGPNMAFVGDPTYPSANGVWQLNTVNLNQDAPAGIGNFQPDDPIPGIPGLSGVVVNDNIVGVFTTYAEFPQAGYYEMGVNSDDGFRVTVAETAPRRYLQVEAPASIAGVIGAAPTAYGIDGALFGGPIPTTPIVAEAILADPIQGCSDFVNAAAIAGKIVLIDRGTCPFVDKARRAQAAGAAAVIIMDNTPQFPWTMGGEAPDVTIPCLLIRQSDGQRLKNNLNGLVLSIGSDSGFLLGQFNAGRGASDTLFGFAVPAAGVYPLRLIWYEGDGGANVEWFTVADDGQKILLNDRTNPKAIRTYRAWNFQALPSADPKIAVARDAAQIVITFEGTLQSADVVNGTWTDMAGAASPLRVAPTGAAKFYRTRR
jgi:hypothetical protein